MDLFFLNPVLRLPLFCNTVKCSLIKELKRIINQLINGEKVDVPLSFILLIAHPSA